MLAPDILGDIVHEFALGSRPVLEPFPARGEQGQVWRLRTTSGTWAVKELFRRQSRETVEQAAQFQEAAIRAGIRAPSVVRNAEGQVLLDRRGRQFRIFEWVALRGPDANLEPAQVGGLVATMHRLGHPVTGPVHPWYTKPVGAARWDQLVDELGAAGHPWAAQLAALRDELCALEPLLTAPAETQQLHLDLWADNVRATATGQLCVIDWDNCGPGDPTQEVAAVLFEYSLGSARRARDLYAAYLDAGGPGRITAMEDFSMLIAQLCHILEMQCQNWLDAATAAERTHTEAAVDEFVSRPVTRAAIEEILAALA